LLHKQESSRLQESGSQSGPRFIQLQVLLVVCHRTSIHRARDRAAAGRCLISVVTKVFRLLVREFSLDLIIKEDLKQGPLEIPSAPDASAK
jgi:hypothetical protein